MSPGDAVYWLRAHRPLERPAARLLCLPYAGGGASLFHHWSAGVPPGVEVRSAQLPGHQDRFHEPGLRSVNDIVEHLGAALKALPQAPLVVYGHSFGALLGYALAQRLRATPLSPRALVVGARRAPQLPATTSNIHHLSDSAFKQELHRRYGTSWALLQNEELMSLAMPALRADMAAVVVPVIQSTVEPPCLHLNLPVPVSYQISPLAGVPGADDGTPTMPVKRQVAERSAFTATAVEEAETVVFVPALMMRP